MKTTALLLSTVLFTIQLFGQMAPPCGSEYNLPTTDLPNCAPALRMTNSESANHDLNIAPNPSKGQVQLFVTSKVRESAIVSFMDSKGAVLIRLPIELQLGKINQSLDLSLYPKGFYFLTISSSQGLITKKVFLE